MQSEAKGKNKPHSKISTGFSGGSSYSVCWPLAMCCKCSFQPSFTGSGKVNQSGNAEVFMCNFPKSCISVCGTAIASFPGLKTQRQQSLANFSLELFFICIILLNAHNYNSCLSPYPCTPFVTTIFQRPHLNLASPCIDSFFVTVTGSFSCNSTLIMSGFA